jgi:hypothetical protein
MTTDYQVLIQKFNNFKSFVQEISPKKEVINEYNKMSESEMILFCIGFLIPNRDKLDIIVSQMATKLEINDEEYKSKIKRYLQCFIEYVNQINSNELLEKTIITCANEQNINLSSHTQITKEK